MRWGIEAIPAVDAAPTLRLHPHRPAGEREPGSCFAGIGACAGAARPASGSCDHEMRVMRQDGTRSLNGLRRGRKPLLTGMFSDAGWSLGANLAVTAATALTGV